MLLFFGVMYAGTLDAHGMFNWDEAEYASLGRSLLHGDGLTIAGVPNKLRPPVLPIAAATSIALSRSTRDVVLKAPNILFSLAALVIVYWSATVQYGPLTGLAASALLGMFPAFWRYTAVLLTEIPYLAFFTGAVVCFYWGLYRSSRFFYASWGFWGLAILTRYTALLFGPIAIVFTAVAWASLRGEAARHLRSRDFLLGPLVAGAMVLPWLVRQQITFGDALVGFKEASSELQLFMPGVSMPWYFYPAQIPGMLSFIPAVLLVAGVWWTARERDRFAAHMAMVCVFLFIWFSAYRFKEIRQVTSALPFLAILAALGATSLVANLRGTRRAAVLVAVLLAAVSVRNALTMRTELARTVTLGYPSFVDALRFVRERTPADATLVGASYPQIYWYTERRVEDFPDEPGLADALRGAEWVIVTNFERGQRAYVASLVAKINPADVRAGNAAIFRDRRNVTVVIRSRVLLERL